MLLRFHRKTEILRVVMRVQNKRSFWKLFIDRKTNNFFLFFRRVRVYMNKSLALKLTNSGGPACSGRDILNSGKEEKREAVQMLLLLENTELSQNMPKSSDTVYSFSKRSILA